MSDLPKIKLDLTLFDKVLEILSWMFLVFLWFITVWNYSSLPKVIPIHFDYKGEADQFGGKGTILGIPIIASVLYIVLTILNKYPHLHNYARKVTLENIEKNYIRSTRLLRIVKLAILIIFSMIVIQTIEISKINATAISVWLLPFSLSLIFIPIILFLVRSKRDKTNSVEHFGNS